MAGTFDSILFVGFGGPTRGCCRRFAECPGEAYCFVRGIVGDRPVGEARIREVAAHYGRFGGVSPFHAFCLKQGGALETALQMSGLRLPVYVGHRYWFPYVRETLEEMARDGRRRSLGVILAPHRSQASWEAYLAEVRKGREAIGGDAPEVEFLDSPWFAHPGFVEAVAGRVREAGRAMGEERFGAARLIFSAHSIPASMAEISPYEHEFAATAAATAAALEREDYDVAYQSGPDAPPGTWLGPDVLEVVRRAAEAGPRDVLLVPAGFLCDHVEVLFDLDVETRETAAECGVGYVRAETVGTHPAFIGMLRDLVAERVRRGPA